MDSFLSAKAMKQLANAIDMQVGEEMESITVSSSKEAPYWDSALS